MIPPIGYQVTALLSDPHTRFDTTVTAGIDRDGFGGVRSVWILDAAQDDRIELPRTHPAPPGRAWVIDLAPHPAGAQAEDDALRTALAEFGWAVL